MEGQSHQAESTEGVEGEKRSRSRPDVGTTKAQKLLRYFYFYSRPGRIFFCSESRADHFRISHSAVCTSQPLTKNVFRRVERDFRETLLISFFSTHNR